MTDSIRDLLRITADRAATYLETLDQRGVGPTPEAVARLSELDEPLPDAPSAPEHTLAVLDEIGSPATMAISGRRFFGFVIGGSVPAALAANWMAGAWDQNAGLRVASPIAAKLEEVALRWLLDILKLPGTAAGAFVTGATMANFTALAAARHAVLAKAGWDVESNGLFGAPPITVIVGAEAHPTLFRSLSMLGLGHQRVVKVPVDDQGRIIASQFPEISGPTIVCTQAGNVNSGGFDPIAEICQKAHAAGAWVHVDGAFGLWANATPNRAHLTAGVADADSWATDAHKWLNVPYDSGLAFIRDPESLRSALRLTAAYLPESDTREPSQFTPELSRRARGTEVWAALRSMGRSGIADLIERNCQFATRFAEGLSAAGYTILNDVVLNQVVVTFGNDESNKRVIAGIQQEGTCWCGPTHWRGQSAMRISISSWATTAEDVERSLAAMLEVADEVRVP
ncbi:MAG: aminotransferase class V-fold PLP-dependent enzyme [Chloroflexi bacterium]|nr:aminotransferase class V-fold PLP-dependent enzyme [Chloroflexota bacterium]MCC6896571.1 aspartate aminotransferase family protein [Anaerolineae bacterium]